MAAKNNYIQEAWNNAVSSASFKRQFIFTLIFFCSASLINFHFLRIWQDRPGVQINDFILNYLPPFNLSLPIFLIEYGTLILVFTSLLPFPDQLVKGIQMAGLILLARTMTIYMVPLETPRDMILLNDPVASFFLHTKDVVVTKDLFFSGHVSLIALLAYVALNRYVKLIATISTIVVSLMILDQHVHYSLDVFFAPIVAYVCYKFVLYIHRETRYGLELQPQEYQ